jgi:hypothetical protein
LCLLRIIASSDRAVRGQILILRTTLRLVDIKPEEKVMAEAKAKVKAKAKAAPKKATAKKAATKKVAAKKTASKKPAVKSKAKATAKAQPKAKSSSKKRARPAAVETGRKALLAGLGVYGKAYDQVLEQFAGMQEQVDDAQNRLSASRKQAEAIYQSLVERGSAVEKDALRALADLELDSLADRSKLEAQMKKAKTRFDQLKAKFGKAN